MENDFSKMYIAETVDSMEKYNLPFTCKNETKNLVGYF